jgi:hypothetical protein
MIKFVHVPATVFEDVDPEYRLYDGEHRSSVSIQDCRLYGHDFQVVIEGPDCEWIEHLSSHRTLKAAKDAAIKIYMQQ